MLDTKLMASMKKEDLADLLDALEVEEITEEEEVVEDCL